MWLELQLFPGHQQLPGKASQLWRNGPKVKTKQKTKKKHKQKQKTPKKKKKSTSKLINACWISHHAGEYLKRKSDIFSSAFSKLFMSWVQNRISQERFWIT